MRATYRVLGYLIALEVIIQAAAIAYAMFGLGKFVEGGGTVDKAMVESDEMASTRSSASSCTASTG